MPHVIALALVAAKASQLIPGSLVLYPLGDRLEAYLVRQDQGRLYDGEPHRILMAAIDEAAIQLELGEGQLVELLHRGVAGAKVIDGEAKAVHPQPA
ncbi:hypothetical protein D3C78_1744180 [compost metagenome]